MRRAVQRGGDALARGRTGAATGQPSNVRPARLLAYFATRLHMGQPWAMAEEWNPKRGWART